MAITTLDGIVAGMKPNVSMYKVAATAKAAGVNHSLWYVTGSPGAGTASSAGAAGEALSSSSAAVAGQIPFPTPQTNQSVYLERLEVTGGTNVGTVFLWDRLWQNSGLSVTSTSSQTVNSVTLPARDLNGATNGDGVFVAMEVSSTMGAGAPTITVTYTNSAGTGSRTGTISPQTTSPVGAIWLMSMQAGDFGVRSIQSWQSNATMTSGAFSIIMYRQIASIGTPTDNECYDRDALSLGFPKCYDGSVPMWAVRAVGTALGQSDMGVVWAQG